MSEEPGYTPKPAFGAGIELAIPGAKLGAVLGSARVIYNLALKVPTNSPGGGYGPALARLGSRVHLIAKDASLLAVIGATYGITEATVSNIREKNDPLNQVAAGCAAGFLAGLRNGTLATAFGGCGALGTVMGVYGYSGDFARQPREVQEEKRRKFFKQPKVPESSSTPINAAE